jgi:hypothetical protein
MNWIVQNWLDALFTVVAAGMLAAIRHVNRKQVKTVERQTAVKNGVVALLRDRIVQAYNHYMTAGRWPIYARDSVYELFAQYKSLGGNGTVADLLDTLKKLPTDDGWPGQDNQKGGVKHE